MGSIFDGPAGVLAMKPRPQQINAAKAITISSAPTIVEPECTDRLIDFLEDESVLVGLMRVIRMTRNEQNLNFIDMSNGLLRPGGCQTTCDTGTITGTRKTLSVHEMKAAIPLCDDVLDTNIEGAALEDHILRMVAKQLANELEVWVLMASTGVLPGSPVYASSLVDPATMLLDNNLYEQLQGGHVLDGLTATDGRFITACKVQQMMQTLPTQYRKNPNLKLFMPDDMIWDWNGVIRSRQTPGGDAQFSGQVDPQLGRLPFVSVPLLPTDITSCSVGSAAGNATFMFLADPDNLVLGIQRDMTFERWRNGCEGRTFLIWTIRVDVLIENTDATVLYDCMDVGSCQCEPCP